MENLLKSLRLSGRNNENRSSRRDQTEKEEFYQRLDEYVDSELRLIYTYFRDDLIHIVGSDPDRILSELEKWTKLKIENYVILKQNLGDAVFAERLVQDILAAGRANVIGFWKYLYSLKKDFPNIPAVLGEILHTGDFLVEKILLDKYGHNLTPELKDIQGQHKKHLLEKTQCLVEHRPPGSTRKKQSIYISERFVNMTVVSSKDFRQRSQHELTETGRRHENIMNKERLMLEHITIKQLFRWSCHNLCDPRVVMVIGVPGVGKTTMMQKFVYDWVTGKLYQRFSFVFFFKFRELNRFHKISLEKMILQEYPYLENQLENILQDPEKLLFIFDGLDESKHQIDFTSSHMCVNPQWPDSCGLVVVSLLRQSLLTGCSVLLTSRPTKLASTDSRTFHRVCEIMGFSSREIQMYFDGFFQDKELSEEALHYVRENDTLYTFCYIPSYCWIICTVLSMCFKNQPANTDQLVSSLPKTVTQLFVVFVSHILSNHSQDNSHALELIKPIGWMAEYGVMNYLLVFDERDLKTFNVETSSHLTSSFIIQFGQLPNVTFSFFHLTVQEFLAALVHFIDYSPEKLQRSLYTNKFYTDGRGEIFLRFLCGFLDSSTRSHLRCLGDFSITTLKDVTSWLQKCLLDTRDNRNLDIGKHLDIFSCLFESQNKDLIENCVGSNRNFLLVSINHLSPVDCTALAFVLKCCRETESLDIQKCNIQSEGWKRLTPVLHTIKTIKLSSTELKDSCVTYIISALYHPACRVEHLELVKCEITERSCPQLASVISKNQTLRTLDLSHNNFTGPHFNELMTALSSPTCQIQELRLVQCGITKKSCPQLSYVISNNQSLRTLDLSYNNLSGPHFSDLTTALSSPICRIQELCLAKCKIKEGSCLQLASVISNNQSLRTLDLSENNLSGHHFNDLMTALSSPTCHIQDLQLRECGITEESCPQLSSVISNNQSLRTLNLSYNNLSGRHFNHLMTALSSPTCRIQKLLLRACDLTELSCPQLASAIRNNQSLRTLDLSYNNLSGPHFSHLMTAMSSPICRVQELCLAKTCLTRNQALHLLLLSHNTNLTHLDLRYNDFQDLGHNAIKDLIWRSPSLKEIRIYTLGWSQDERDSVMTMQSPTLTILDS